MCARTPSVYVVEELTVAGEEAVVHEGVVLDTREREHFVVGLGQTGVVGWHEVAARALPRRPAVRALELRALVVAEQPSVVGRDQVVALVDGDGRDVVLPRVGIDV